MGFNRLENAYDNYYGIKNFTDRIRKQGIIPINDWLDSIYKREKQMVADLIVSSVDTDKIVEFSNTFYLDDNILMPTISENFAKDGRSATLISKNINNGAFGNVTTIENDRITAFYDYSEVLTQSSIKSIEEAKCFVTEQDFPRLFNHYKNWAGMGIPCVYAISGQLDGKLKEKIDDANKNFTDAIKDNNLSYKTTFDYDPKINSVARIYILTKESK